MGCLCVFPRKASPRALTRRRSVGVGIVREVAVRGFFYDIVMIKQNKLIKKAQRFLTTKRARAKAHRYDKKATKATTAGLGRRPGQGDDTSVRVTSFHSARPVLWWFFKKYLLKKSNQQHRERTPMILAATETGHFPSRHR